ncbi:hypothetical protein SAMN05518669_10512 [Variovorax sp. YR634]|uniref:hypothetical protein n=1 Tax=Variovorax sp. YR634 TaxID=1884385 RepID=UPI000897BF6C|nr:hypothetical protein [Variovorax sp. YR634]SDX47344.1 hypothetical protein SAMN05518669_10512 [Variovorax sp. YR634]
MPDQKFIAFYASRPFWTDEAIDLSQSKPERWFHMMKEIRYEYTSAEFSLKIARDSAIMLCVPAINSAFPTATILSIETPMEKWRKYLEHINAFYLLLDTATMMCSKALHFNLHEITLRDAFTVTLDNNGDANGWSIPQQSYAALHLNDRHLGNHNPELPLSVNPNLAHRNVIKNDVIEHAVSRFKKAVAQPGLIEILSSFAKSLTEFKDGNFETSLVLSWFLIESHMNMRWKEYLNSINKEIPPNKKRINADRLKLLTGNNYTASIVSQQLELADLIDWKTFSLIDSTRKIRNDLAHVQGTKATLDQARTALTVTHSLIETRWNLDFPLNDSLNIAGI